ncbi:cyclin family protein [Candidiatus Paracoxiella cheracis]|uniref:cyclin family protein n=1 Tax=Candidiatus Paracoxiella cheracis TaxID=3405120 RepID=UPI003BF59835
MKKLSQKQRQRIPYEFKLIKKDFNMSRESQSSTDKNFTDGPLTPLEKKVFAFFFQNLFEKGSRLQAQSSFLSIFQYKPLSISVENYIDNLEKSDVTFSHMVLAVIYILRLHTTSCNIKRPIYIHPLTIAYLLPTALTLAQKYLDDMATYNIDMAHAACIPLPIMNKLEREMLFTMQGNLYVSPSYYQTIIRGVFSEYNSQASSFKILPKSSLPPDRRLTDSDIATFNLSSG